MENVERLQSKLQKLQKDNEILETQIHLADSEQRAALGSSKSVMKKNTMEMKELRMQIEELKVRLHRQEMTEEKVIREALQQRCRDRAMFEGHTAKECIQMVESRALDLNNKSQSLSHGLQLAERTLTDNKNVLKEIIDGCRDDLPTEADCLQHIRDLENEHQKVLKNIEEAENARNKYKNMREHLRQKLSSQYWLLMDLKKEKIALDADEYDAKYGDIEKEESFVSEDMMELKKLQDDFTKLKDATGSCDISEIYMRFLEQKSMQEDLQELKRKAEKRLQELKEEKRDLTSKMSLVKGVDTICPKSEAETFLAKNRLKEQEIRLETAKSELDRIISTSNSSRESFQKLIKRMNSKVKDEDLQNMTVLQLASHLEKLVLKKIHHMETVWAATVKSKK